MVTAFKFIFHAGDDVPRSIGAVARQALYVQKGEINLQIPVRFKRTSCRHADFVHPGGFRIVVIFPDGTLVKIHSGSQKQTVGRLILCPHPGNNRIFIIFSGFNRCNPQLFLIKIDIQ